MSEPARPNVNPSARARFQSVQGNITGHRAMIERDSFDKGADAAMLEYASKLAMNNLTGNDAMASGFKLQGAQEFLMFFKQIAEQPPSITVRPHNDNLPDASKLTRQ